MRVAKFFKNKQGKVVLGQRPNLSLMLAIGFYLTRYLPYPFLDQVSFWGVMISLLYWSGLEIVSGVNSWRRMLGVIVLAYQLMQLIQVIR